MTLAEWLRGFNEVGMEPVYRNLAPELATLVEAAERVSQIHATLRSGTVDVWEQDVIDAERAEDLALYDLQTAARREGWKE